ncbi:hypothetical protein [Methanosarcina siciliae]|uniref:hypothetical protein n=1 Tax=Methanosarcina siciliae TaxID=38027 RepID=UPI0012E0AFC0|nr:hypothetical protein [Methanosarcina siciliae]
MEEKGWMNDLKNKKVTKKRKRRGRKERKKEQNPDLMTEYSASGRNVSLLRSSDIFIEYSVEYL